MIKTRYMIAVFAALILLGACKTNEKNMFDAYDKAMAATKADDDEIDTYYKGVRKEMRHEDIVVGGDTIDLSSQWVRPTEDGGYRDDNFHRYCVVVGQFKQRFNALSMRERLTTHGYPDCFVLQTREPYYFVVANSYYDLDKAVALMHQAQTDTIFRFKSPLPFILRPAQLR